MLAEGVGQLLNHPSFCGLCGGPNVVDRDGGTLSHEICPDRLCPRAG